jgi:hypothetical protein
MWKGILGNVEAGSRTGIRTMAINYLHRSLNTACLVAVHEREIREREIRRLFELLCEREIREREIRRLFELLCEREIRRLFELLCSGFISQLQCQV